MKGLKLRGLDRVYGLLLGLSLFSLVLALHSQTPAPVRTAIVQDPTHAFFVRIYGNKCLDFSASPQAGTTPVVIATCNNSATQQILVQ
jgi:hypothetical protein